MRGPSVSRAHIGLAALLAALCAALALTPASIAAPANSVKVRLVIEGQADSSKSITLNGVVSLCEEQVEGRLEDETTYLRGRGVTLEVRRHKSGGAWKYSVRRVGHSNAEFTVAAVRERKASGTEELRDLPKLPGYCPKEHKNLAETPGCGSAGRRITHNDVGLKIIGSTEFTVVASAHERPESLPKPTCGETTTTDGFLELFYEFPHFPEVAPAALPEAGLFGHAKALVVTLKGEGKERAEPIKTPTLSGVAIDSGKSNVTVRFIKCGAAHLPAC
jgi:hypothetical protein